MTRLIRRFQYWKQRRRAEADLAEELEFHRAALQREIEASGMSPEEARMASRRAMGNATLAREDARSVWILPWLESVWQDIAYAVRNLRRQPGFTLVALVALGSAIGLNTSLFTAFSALALRPWPVPHPDRVVTIFSSGARRSDGTARIGGFPIVEFRYLAEHTKTLSGMIAKREGERLKVDGRVLSTEYVNGSHFRALGVEMERGRGFMDEEDHTGAPEAVAVLSYGAWQDRFGADDGIVGRRIRFEDVPFTIVGVASRDFAGTSPNRVDVWIPFSAMPLLRPHDPSVLTFLTKPEDCCASLAGRLAPSVDREQARAELEGLSAQFRSESGLEKHGIVLAGTPFLANPSAKRSMILPVFGLMFAGVILVLLLACANVSNLLLARAAARRSEIAVRLSLGAGRGRVVRQLLTESLVLACAAGALGVLIAETLPSYILSRAAGDVSFRMKPDATVLAWTLGLCVFACAIFGLAPALHGTRSVVAEALKGGARKTRVRLSARGVLLAVQVAVSVVLLIAAGLLIRGVQHARTGDPGFAVQDVASLSFDFPANAYDAARQRGFYQRLVSSLEAGGGSTPFGLTMLPPLGPGRAFTSFRLPGENEADERMVQVHEVSRGYFEVLRIPVVAGRNFEPADAERKFILVNQAMARRYWPDKSAVGQTLFSDGPREVAGVVKDAYTSGLDQIEPTIYLPSRNQRDPKVLIRTADPGAIQAVTAMARDIDPRVQLQVTPLADNLDEWLSSSRVGAAIAGGLGALALALATIGMFGVFAYVVEQRTREIGIRMALGANPSQVVRIVLGSTSRALLVGVVVGIAGSLVATRLLTRYLYGLSPLDPMAYGAVAAILVVAGLTATWLPARRATRVDPLMALRYE